METVGAEGGGTNSLRAYSRNNGSSSIRVLLIISPASRSHFAACSTEFIIDLGNQNVMVAEEVMGVSERKRLYLRVGDEVSHLRYEEWGIGVVMEVMTSSVPGGTCLVRVRFQDGQLRCFNNDLDNEACCYYFGVRRYWNPTHGVNAVRSKFFLPG
jgi:hypothetical protein